MAEDLIIKNVLQHISLSEVEQPHFLSLLQTRKVKRKHFLLHEGNVSRHSIFVTKGCLRSYTVGKNGTEHVLSFAPPGWWIADMYSLISGKPGLLNIEALEDSDVFLLSKEAEEELYRTMPQFERFFRIIISNSLVAYQQRVIDGMTLTAEERYKKFCSVYPTLIYTLPQKQIAAYIDVTPEFLSVVKNGSLRK
jgi:CRP-like cAMP-binding protein